MMVMKIVLFTIKLAKIILLLQISCSQSVWWLYIQSVWWLYIQSVWWLYIQPVWWLYIQSVLAVYTVCVLAVYTVCVLAVYTVCVLAVYTVCVVAVYTVCVVAVYTVCMLMLLSCWPGIFLVLCGFGNLVSQYTGRTHDHMLTVFGNRVLRETFGPQWEKVRGE